MWKVDSLRSNTIVRLNGQGKVKIYITMPTLTKASLSGSGDMRTTNRFDNLDNLEVGISGSGNLTLAASAKSIDARMSGSGSVVLAGDTQEFRNIY